MPHIHEKIDFCAETFIVHKNKVLLRRHDKLGIWLSVGGHIELDEDPNEAAVREVKEEVGLDIELYGSVPDFPENKELIPPMFMNRHRINETHEHIALTFFARCKNPTLKLSETEVSSDVGWFSKEEVEQMDLVSNVRHHALSALEKLKE